MKQNKKIHIIDHEMRTCEVGELQIIFHKKDKRVEIKLIDQICEHTLIHFMDFEDWKKMVKIE